MIPVALQEEYARERPDLPHPLEPPAVIDMPYGPVPDYADTLVECRECGRPLAASEYDPDYDGDSEGYTFCGRDTCRECEAEHG